MSQILERPRTYRGRLIQDVHIESMPYLPTNAAPASCHVCGRGLGDGHCLAARMIRGEAALLCEEHASQDQPAGDVTAPRAAEPTRDAYLARAPPV